MDEGANVSDAESVSSMKSVNSSRSLLGLFSVDYSKHDLDL